MEAINWEAVTALSEAIGVIVIIASLIFIGFQIRQTSQQLQNQTENLCYERVFQAYDPVFEGRNAEIFHAGLHAPETLEGNDAFVFDLLMHRQFGAMSQVARQMELRALPPGAAKNFAVHYRWFYLDSTGGRRWFEKNREMFDQQLEILGLDQALNPQQE